MQTRVTHKLPSKGIPEDSVHGSSDNDLSKNYQNKPIVLDLSSSQLGEVAEENTNIHIEELKKSVIRAVVTIEMNLETEPEIMDDEKNSSKRSPLSSQHNHQQFEMRKEHKAASQQPMSLNLDSHKVKRKNLIKNLTQFYTKSFGVRGRQIENPRSKTVVVSRAEKVEELQDGGTQIKTDSKDAPFPKKKWVFCKICRLGNIFL